MRNPPPTVEALRTQLAAARAALRSAIEAYVATPCDVNELTVATRGATVCAIEKRIDERHGSLASLFG